MASSGVVQLSANITGAGVGLFGLNPANVIQNGINSLTSLVLQAGDNVITVPAGATMAIIVPPSTNTQALKTKGTNAGDTGELCNASFWWMKTFPTAAPPATFIINAAGLTVGNTNIFFI